MNLLAPIERVAGYDTMMPYPTNRSLVHAERRPGDRGRAPRGGLPMTAFNLPDLGEGLREAEIVAWHVAEGDHVVVDQPLLSVETEKAVVEIPSPRSGHIARLLAHPGERAQVGAPLLEFEEGPHAETGTVVGELAPSAPATSAPKHRPPRPPWLRRRDVPRPRSARGRTRSASTFHG